MQALRRGRRALALAAVTALAAPVAAQAATASAARKDPLRKVRHIVVVYEENHSFDNLYGGWEGVNGRSKTHGRNVFQVTQAGTKYTCLEQNDLNLQSPPLTANCTDTTTGSAFESRFPNRPFAIEDYIRPEDTTCPAPGQNAPNGVYKGSGEPGGCTRDLVHRYYQEQYQIDAGKQDRYVTGSDAVGLTMGYYDTRKLPVYRYLHAKGAPRYAIADRFFQAAFGGSFLNHQWLVAANTPVFPNAPKDGSANDQHSLVDTNGMPTSYPLYTATGKVKDGALTQACPAAPGVTCGDLAVNTIQPASQPFAPGTAAARRLPLQTAPTIGDRLSFGHVDWGWYSGGWSNAAGNVGAPGWTNGMTPQQGCTDPNTISGAQWPYCADKLFQFHHQPLNYFASFAPGTEERDRHLRDEVEFLTDARRSDQSCKLRQVSFIKPIGAENEHPGYASAHTGSDHLVTLLKSVEDSACAKDTMVVVTYDEFGGQWDHVAPPGTDDTAGPHDSMGPGTRIPALVLAPRLPYRAVRDDVSHDTTSIMATIEKRYGLPAVATRDAKVADLSSVWTGSRIRQPK